MFELLAQSGRSTNSQLIEFLRELPEEVIIPVMILSVIFTFVTVLVTTLTVADAYKSITLAKLSKQMVDDLLAKGYTPQEIESLVHGPSSWKKFRKFFGHGKSRDFPMADRYGRPVPPVKHS